MSDNQTPNPTAAGQQQEAAAVFAPEQSAAAAAGDTPVAAGHASEESMAEPAGEELAAPACDGATSEAPARENYPAVPVGEKLPAPASDAPASEKPVAAPMGERLLMALGGPVSPAPPERAAVSAGISNKALQRLHPQVSSVMQIIARRPPVVAGQSAADYYELLEMILQEWTPGTYGECSLVKQLADSEWQVLTFEEVRKWLFNAEIAESLVARIVDETSGEQKSDRSLPQNSGGGPTSSEILRAARRVVFAAVAGNTSAIDVLENKVGLGPVAMGPYFAEQFAARIPAHIFADRAITAALARRDAAFRQLHILAAERQKRFDSKRMTLQDIRATLPLSEYVKLSMELFPTAARDKPAGEGS